MILFILFLGILSVFDFSIECVNNSRNCASDVYELDEEEEEERGMKGGGRGLRAIENSKDTHPYILTFQKAFLSSTVQLSFIR